MNLTAPLLSFFAGAGNLVKPVVDGEAMLAAFFTHDSTPPRLLNFTLNMDTGKQKKGGQAYRLRRHRHDQQALPVVLSAMCWIPLRP